MAGLARTGIVRHGKSITWNTDLDYNIHDHHPTHSAVRPILNEPNVHYELHHTVCNTYRKRGTPQLTS